MVADTLAVLGVFLGLWWAPEGLSHAPAQVCDRATLHPLSVQIELQEDLEPSRWLVAKVSVESRVDLPSAALTLEPSAGVEIQGPRHFDVGPLDASDARTIEIRIRVADQREPVRVVASFVGDGPQGPLRRGASLQMLPQGPLYPREIVPQVGKRSEVHRYRGALRRIK